MKVTGAFHRDEVPIIELADTEEVQNSILQQLHPSNCPEIHSTGHEHLERRSRAALKEERRNRVRASYQQAMKGPNKKRRSVDFPWITWIVALLTCGIWCITAYQVAINAGAHTFSEMLANVFSNSQDANVLIAFGAKEDSAILAGQYWRFLTPVFLHASLLQLVLNMLNFVILGIVIEPLFGHSRFLLIYLVTGIVSIIASFAFEPQEISVGASGAIFGLVGAYGVFIVMHRQAFRYGGILPLGWLIFVIGINLGIDFVIPNVDHYAHIGGLISGCLLGWLFAPFYSITRSQNEISYMKDVRSLAYRWPLALCTIAITFLLASITIHFVGG